MLAGILLVALAAAPELKVEQNRVDAALLRAARAALERGDAVALNDALGAWATISARSDLPEGLERHAATAVAMAKEEGLLRVYASRAGGRVRVGVSDPANVIDRVDVWLDVAPTPVRLPRREDGARGRFEYLLDPRDARAVFVDAVSTRFGPSIRLVRVTLAPDEAELPSAPDPTRLTDNTLAEAPPRAARRAVRDASPVPWWVIVGGVVAAGLAGAAVYQETRF